MDCTSCGIQNKPVFRSNPKGESAIWKCADCLDVPPPKDVVDIVKIFSDEDDE